MCLVCGVDIAGFSDDAYISIQFRVTHSFNRTKTFVAAAFSRFYTLQEMSAQSFYGQKPEDRSEVDLDSMWSFNQQFINLEKLNGTHNLFLSVFNLQGEAVHYEITVLESPAPLCLPCANNETQLDSCSCENCTEGIGKYCPRQIVGLTQSVEINLPSQGMKHFEIPTWVGEQVRVEVRLKEGKGETYFAYVDYEGEVASFYNVLTLPSGEKAIYPLSKDSIAIANIAVSRRPLSLTIANFNSADTTAIITMEIEGGSSGWVVFWAFFGSCLGFVIIGMIFNACHRRRSRSQMLGGSDRLSEAEIEEYFPPVPFKEVREVPGQQPTMRSMLPEKPQDPVCVICL